MPAVPRGRAVDGLTIAVDTREKYRWRFAGREVSVEHRALQGGDYAAMVDDQVVALVERKTLADLASSLSNGSLAFQMQRLAESPRAAVVVDGECRDLFRTQPGRGSSLTCWVGWLRDIQMCPSFSPAHARRRWIGDSGGRACW